MSATTTPSMEQRDQRGNGTCHHIRLVANRPDLTPRHAGHTGELIVRAGVATVWTGHDGPSRAVPVLGKGDRMTVLACGLSDSPHILSRNPENSAKAAHKAGAGSHAPGRAVPTLDQRPGVSTHCPRVGR